MSNNNVNAIATLTNDECALSVDDAITQLSPEKLRAYVLLQQATAKKGKRAQADRPVVYKTGTYTANGRNAKEHFMLIVEGDGKPFQKGVGGICKVLGHKKAITALMEKAEGSVALKGALDAMGCNLYQTNKILRHEAGFMKLINENLNDERVAAAVEKHLRS